MHWYRNTEGLDAGETVEIKADEIMDLIHENYEIFDVLKTEVSRRRSDDFNELIHQCVIGVDIRNQMGELFYEVLVECLKENINFFDQWERLWGPLTNDLLQT